MNIFKLLLVSLLFISFSCNQNNDKIKVGILFGTYEATRWNLEKKYLEEKINELGAELITKITEGDELEQFAQAKELIELGVDVLIIIAVNGNTAGSIVRDAHKNGIKVIAYDKLIQNSELDFFITFSGEKAGELMAEYAINKIPQGNYVLLYGDRTDENANKIHDGVKAVLQPLIDSKKINIVYEGFTDQWATINAAYTTNKIIEFSDTQIDVIIATFNSVTYGAKAAVHKYGLENEILVVGHDPDLEVCQDILNGKDVLAVHKTVKNIAYKTAEIAIELATNKTIQTSDKVYNGRMDVPSIILAPVVVNKKNIETIIFEEGYIKKEDVLNFKKEF